MRSARINPCLGRWPTISRWAWQVGGEGCIYENLLWRNRRVPVG